MLPSQSPPHRMNSIKSERAIKPSNTAGGPVKFPKIHLQKKASLSQLVDEMDNDSMLGSVSVLQTVPSLSNLGGPPQPLQFSTSPKISKFQSEKKLKAFTVNLTRDIPNAIRSKALLMQHK